MCAEWLYVLRRRTSPTKDFPGDTTHSFSARIPPQGWLDDRIGPSYHHWRHWNENDVAGILGGLTALAAATLAWPAQAGDMITVISTPTSNGYNFINFDGPTPNGGGTTMDGISNTGFVVGFTADTNGNLQNFTADPTKTTAATVLNINGSTTAMANGINSSNLVVGFDGNVSAFTLNGNSLNSFIPSGGTSAMAFGVNDQGMIAGSYTTASGTMPGFVLNGTTVTTINAPISSNMVNAQGINNNGLVVGFYVGADGNDHGFDFKLSSAVNNVGTLTPIMDPNIIPQEPNATFVFSQILGINDKGIAVGYYGDSTGSQHGFLYNTNTGAYTFLDDPNAEFTSGGVEVTQITGISNSGEITGFYTDSSGEAHGFVAYATPEPSSIALLGIGVTVALGYARVRRRQTRAAV